MKRQDKFPDTKVFHYFNANPKNKITDDCVVRALSLAMDKSWADVLKELTELSLKTGYMINSKECYNKYLESYGWIKCKQPRKYDNTKFTGKEFCNLQQAYLRTGVEEAQGIKLSQNIIAHIGGHHIVAIIDGIINDTWNSSEGSIGNYYIKKED